jgi:hypothetical protein
VGIGAAGAGASIGAAVSRNLIGYDLDGQRVGAPVQAYATDSDIVADGDLTLTATSAALIESMVAAGSVALAAGAVGVAGSGAGVSSENRIGFDVRASIDGDGASEIAADRITVSAEDRSTIHALAGAASIAATFALIGGASLAIGVALAENEIANQVDASLQDTARVIATVGGITVTADEAATIEAVAAAAAAAVALAPKGTAISGGAATATNTLAGTVAASIASSADVQSASAVEVAATDTSSIDAQIVAASLAGGLVSVAVGVSLSENTITEHVHAFIDGSTVTAGSGDISITSSTQPTITTVTEAAALSAGLGFAMAGVDSLATIDDDVAAYARNATLNAPAGSVRIDADATHTANTHIDSAAAGGVGISVMTAVASIQGTTRAFADGVVGISANALSVTADSNSTALPDGTSIAIGLAGGAGAKLEAVIERATEAYVGARVGQTPTALSALTFTNGDVLIQAGSTSRAEATPISLGVGLAGVGGAVTIATIDAVTRAYVGRGASISAGELDVLAHATEDAIANTVVVGAGPLSGAGALATAAIGSTVEAFIGAPVGEPPLAGLGTTIALTAGGSGDGTAVVQATSTSTADAEASGGSGGGVSVTVFLPSASVNGVTRAFVGEGASVTAVGVELLADSIQA